MIVENIFCLFQGGLVYVAIKGVLRIYQRHQNAKNLRTMKVADLPDFDVPDNSYSDSDTDLYSDLSEI